MTEKVESKIREKLDQRLNDPEKAFFENMELIGLSRDSSMATATIRDKKQGS